MDTNVLSGLVALKGNLRRYLPGQLMHALFDQSGPAAARPCSDHLSALLHTVSTYLPRYLVGEQLRQRQPGLVSGQFRHATIMFADISGFTALSERLSRRGEEGAEKIARIVGDYFTAVLDITTRQGGDLLKFGGDALLIAFFDDDDAALPELGGAMRACRAAVQMQQAIARWSHVEAFGETYSLKMTAGLGTGLLFLGNLGTVEKMEYTAMGDALTSMAHAEDQAQGGEIFLDQATYQAARSQARIGDTRNGCYQLVEIRGGESAGGYADILGLALPSPGDDVLSNEAASLVSHIQEMVACLDVLTPFLPPGLLDQLRFSPAQPMRGYRARTERDDPASMAASAKGEFRPVTVMFANFYGAEDIIRRLGPAHVAEITAVLNDHFTRMQDIIHRYEGVIDKVATYAVGHRIMAMFGAPRAHVDDPERAVRAALEMQAAMQVFRQLETSAGVFALKQRIGINTGRVFAGNIGSAMRQEYTVMGDEVNLADRLMAVAREGQVIISHSTAAQTGQRFLLQEQPPVRVKGKSQPVPSYEVRGVIERHEADRTARRAPLVGRSQEWQSIWRTAQQAVEGSCQVLDIHGEMGMGKSRALEELMDRWSGQGGAVLFAGCFSYGRHVPYAPWAVILRQLFGLRDDESDLERGGEITRRLAAINPAWSDWAALVAHLVGVSMPESDLLKSLDPRLRQQNLQRIVGGLIVSEAEHRPTLLVVDDIQWIDEPSLGLLNHLTAPKPYPLLICVAYRPEESRRLAAQGSNFASVALQALSEADSLALLDSHLPTAPEMPGRLKELILKNAQGNPLFIVEMTRALIENYMSYDAASGVYRARADLDRVQVPDTVSRVILSRLDRLDEQSRNILKVASVIGREFRKWLLQTVYPYPADEAELDSSLLDLTAKEILDRTQLAYLFRHVMTREVAYESLLYAERRDLHFRIARSIEAQPGERLDEYVEVLAEHCTLAEDWPRALQYHLQAARRAQAIYANQDAIHRYQKALQIAQHTTDSQREQAIAHEGLGDTYQLVGRYDESLQSYAQARVALEHLSPAPDVLLRRADLCRKTGRVHEDRGEYGQALAWVERGLDLMGGQAGIEAARLYLGGAAVFHRQGRFQDAIRWCQQSLDLSEKLNTTEATKAAAHASYLLGYSFHRLGEMDKASACYYRSLDLYETIEDRPGVARAYNNLANFSFDQNDWMHATEYYRQALVTLERMGDVHGQAVVANNLGGLLLNQGQLDQARAWYKRSLDISEELGVNLGVALVRNNLGHVCIRAGEWTGALDHLLPSLEMFQRIGAQEYLPELYCHLAEAHLGQGDLAEAHSWADKSLERALAAEMKLEEGCARRVLGNIYQAEGRAAEAKVELERSLDILQALANSYEVARTAIQLAALYAAQGDRARAAPLRREAVATFERLGAMRDLAQADADPFHDS